jgi:hypothetical protein
MANTLVFEVDSDTAGYPWEMVDDGDAQQDGTGEPWALRLTGALLRKMLVDEFRRQPVDAQTDGVLVVGAPKLDATSGMPDLPGARDEATAVAALFGASAHLLLDSDFLSIVKPALARSWKVIHMAGHGMYDAAGGQTGMLMSGGLVFGPTEFESMPTVPELVFVNCCHLGKTEHVNQPRHTLFAANVAEQLIRNGVRCSAAATLRRQCSPPGATRTTAIPQATPGPPTSVTVTRPGPCAAAPQTMPPSFGPARHRSCPPRTNCCWRWKPSPATPRVPPTRNACSCATSCGNWRPPHRTIGRPMAR